MTPVTNDRHCHARCDEPPTAVLAILDTFRRSPRAISDEARETLCAFGLIEPDELHTHEQHDARDHERHRC
ncbi:hypothetical protein RHODGE_RHODGE_01720 [Rhodoplanes serenus]|uniref:Uncharacterized protein n=1 Tax=Rhodoplanes serenus TaxID=200615 RepID=A0A447CTM2_9BRAD|nr:hypothetical protein [Rhodoplanes serenus]MBI5111711.1 hypothetical protein [Rhodovulum sp.]VCU08555.1 hypothetical protein RHODGE_RHODGE_01720 [Rhodoplanes serenus]